MVTRQTDMTGSGAARPGAAVRGAVPAPGAVRDAYREELDPGPARRAAELAVLHATFAAVRGITYSIRAGQGPFRNVSAGGEHLHHYLWGIGMLAGIGAVAVRGEDRHRRHPAVALVYGSGLALIVDEFALLLDLKDVYWARQGRISIDLGVGGSAVAGTALAARPVLRRLARDRAAARDRPRPGAGAAGTGPAVRRRTDSEQAQQPARARHRGPGGLGAAAQFPVGGDHDPGTAHGGGQLRERVVAGPRR